MSDEVQPSFGDWMRKIEALIKEGNLGPVAELLRRTPEKWRERPRFLASIARLRFKSGDSSGALSAVESAIHAGASQPGIFLLKAEVHKRLGQSDEYQQTLKSMLAQFPGNPVALKRLTVHHLTENNLGAARACVAELPDTPDMADFRMSVDYRIAVCLGDVGGVVAALDQIALGALALPALPELRGVLLEIPKEKRDELVQKLTVKWPDLSDKIETKSYSLTARLSKRSAKDQAMALALGGQTQKAQNLLKRTFPNGKMDTGTMAMIDCLPPESSQKRPIVFDNGGDVVASKKGKTGTTLLVFTGLRDRAMMPIEFIDRFCAAEGHSVVYIRDVTRSGFIGGVPALAQDFSGSLAALSKLVDDFDTKKLLCLGTSFGGFGAIRHAIQLKADRVLAASAPTNVTSEFLADIDDKRGRLVARRLHRTFPFGRLDLLPEVVAAQGRCHIDLWFGSEHEVDVQHARYLSDCPGVSLFPISELGEHLSLPHVIASGAFEEFLNR
ncbi:hypothetical protein BXY66_2388 [Shimia isoporae]|uniref:Uncharacterized protein n=1 Tax=Shimia isoporae TaxID=647720 RepID=A0A4R1NR08_9RHOB|nr:hypothetical protein [Shimia isoporae]TCL10319.1 hypothetical protein BXY66_2388 [Shimia isoporae]